MMGAAYATLLGYGVMAVSLYFFAQRYYTIQYEFGRLTKLLAVVAVIFYFGYYFEHVWELVVRFGHLVGLTGILTDVAFNKLWEISIKVTLLLGFPVFLYFTGFFEQREIKILKGFL
jgi:hypothetical protein